MGAFKPDPGGLPDDAINAFVYNRWQMTAITGSETTPPTSTSSPTGTSSTSASSRPR